MKIKELVCGDKEGFQIRLIVGFDDAGIVVSCWFEVWDGAVKIGGPLDSYADVAICIAKNVEPQASMGM